MRLLGYSITCVLSAVVGGGVVLIWLLHSEAGLPVRKLVVVDDDGNVRARLHVTESGRVSFALNDLDSGRPRILLGVDKDGTPSISLVGKENDPALVATTKK